MTAFPTYRDGCFVYTVAHDHRRNVYTIARAPRSRPGIAEDVPNSPACTMALPAARMMVEYANRRGLVQTQNRPGDVAASRRAQERIAI